MLEAIVTPNEKPTCFIISCILFDKLKHYNWRIVQSHQRGERSYVYVKMRQADLLIFHGKMFKWGEARATLCSVHIVFPVTPEPMDAHLVVKLA